MTVVQDPNRPIVDESIENVGASTSHYLRRHPFAFLVPLAVAVCAEVIFIFMGVTSDVAYIIPVIIPIVCYNIVRGRVQAEFMQQFAAANGFSFVANASLAGLDGSLFQIGDSRSATNAVIGQFQGHAISLFTYSYSVGSGRSRQTYIDTVYELQFDTAMPDMLLENRSHISGAPLMGIFSGRELVKLEGDFNKFFSLYIPKGYEVEALEVFAPNVMAELIDKARQFGIEIVNGHLFIYRGGIVSTKQDLYALYDVAQYFIETLGPVLARMKPALENGLITSETVNGKG